MIQVENLTMQLRGGGHVVSILKGLSFEVPRKQMVSVVGPSGSGKSTLLGLLAGLDKPTAGSIRLNGREITTWTESQLAHFRRQNIGYLFQSFHLIPTLTALENVMLPLELSSDSGLRRLALGNYWKPWGCKTVRTTIPPNSPEASSSAWQWRELLPAVLPFCWRTSLPGIWTVRPGNS